MRNTAGETVGFLVGNPLRCRWIIFNAVFFEKLLRRRTIIIIVVVYRTVKYERGRTIDVRIAAAVFVLCECATNKSYPVGYRFQANIRPTHIGREDAKYISIHLRSYQSIRDLNREGG